MWRKGPRLGVLPNPTFSLQSHHHNRWKSHMSSCCQDSSVCLFPLSPLPKDESPTAKGTGRRVGTAVGHRGTAAHGFTAGSQGSVWP